MNVSMKPPDDKRPPLRRGKVGPYAEEWAAAVAQHELNALDPTRPKKPTAITRVR
jgi:hypothetical protein